MKDRTIQPEFAINGVTIAPGVVETIVSLAASEVDGVASIGSAGTISTIAAAFNSGKAIPTTGIEVEVIEGNKVSVSLEIKVFYSHRIADVAANVRSAVAEALAAQIGAEVTSVDIHVDGIASEE